MAVLDSVVCLPKQQCILGNLLKNKDKTNSSGKKDDLNIWRLYGGNARGICVVFLISNHQQKLSVLKSKNSNIVAKEE
mgnify:CR=1 FL=1